MDEALVARSGLKLRAGLRADHLWKVLLSTTALAPLGLSAAFMLGGTVDATAANECGAPVAGVVNCNGPSYSTEVQYDPAPATGLTLNIDNPATIFLAPIDVSGSSASDYIVNATRFNSLTSIGSGIYVNNNSTGAAILTMDSGSVAGGQAGGTLVARSADLARITLNGGFVSDTNVSGGALDAIANVAGTVIIEMNGGSVTSSGFGLRARNAFNSTAETLATLNDGIVQSDRDGVASLAERGSATTTITGGTVNSGGNGLVADIVRNTATTNSLVSVQNGAVTSTGNAVDGILARNAGTGATIVEMSGGTVSATGSNSDGVFAQTTNAAGTVDVTVSGGTLTGGTGNGAAIHTMALAGGGTLSIGAGARVDGSASGVAIRDGDANRDGVDENNDNLTFVTAGTLIGDVILGGGTDAMTITGGSIDGNVTGDGADSLTFDLGGGSFTYDTAYTLAGMDSVTMASGTAEVDGALSTNTMAINGGKLILNNAATASGGATIAGGTLDLGDDTHGAATLTGAVDLLAGGRLQGDGTIVGDLGAAGVIAPGNSIGTLTIAGNYTGTGATLDIETALGGDASATDKLVVTGDTAGTTNIAVSNVGGAGAATVEGIKIVDVGGASNGVFTLLGSYTFEGDPAVVAGAYAYRLYQGAVSTPADGDWYLRSTLIPAPAGPSSPPAAPGPLYQPGVPLYEAYAGVLQSFNQLGTLEERLGDRSWTLATDAPVFAGDTAGVQKLGLWGRIQTAHANFAPQTSTSGTDYDSSVWKLQTGLDMPITALSGGELIGSVNFQYGTVSSNINSVFGTGSINATGYALGGTLTWYGDSGFYVDGQARFAWYDSNINSGTAGLQMAGGNKGAGYALSIEAGQRVALAPGWSLIPQAQLGWSGVSFDSFTDAFGARVALDSANSLIGRVGLALDRETAWQDRAGGTSKAHVYAIANLYHDFADGSHVDVAGTALQSGSQSLAGGLGIGTSLSLADDKYSLHAEALAKTSLGNSGNNSALSGSIGFHMSW